jgi:hypothetical protein
MEVGSVNRVLSHRNLVGLQFSCVARQSTPCQADESKINFVAMMLDKVEALDLLRGLT